MSEEKARLEEIERLRGERNGAQNALMTFKVDAERWKERAFEIERGRDRWQRVASELERDNKKLEEQLTTALRRGEHAQAECVGLERENAQLRQRLDELAGENSARTWHGGGE